MKRKPQYVVCVGNNGYAASLEVRKIYQLIPDRAGAKHGLARIVDEMGEDYLFPEEYFIPLCLPSGGGTGDAPSDVVKLRHRIAA